MPSAANRSKTALNALVRFTDDRPSDAHTATQALTTFYRRQARTEHPAGTFDGGGRWYPSGADDACDDMAGIRAPSRAWPWTYMQRCRTLEHCELLYGAGHDDVLAIRRALTALGYDGRVLVAEEISPADTLAKWRDEAMGWLWSAADGDDFSAALVLGALVQHRVQDVSAKQPWRWSETNYRRVIEMASTKTGLSAFRRLWKKLEAAGAIEGIRSKIADTLTPDSHGLLSDLRLV